MSLKEFDAKQFLLEKGERVGLGVAVALMVLMLIFSLFMPSNGFFSGSPAAKAEVLKKGTEQLETALRTRQPSDNDKPEKREGGMPNLDTTYLPPAYYEALAWFEPSIKETPSRRPPKILNVVEAVAQPAHVSIDTYMFEQDFKKILVLEDKESKRANATGGNNPFGAAFGRGGRGMSMPGMPPGMGGNYFQQSRNRLRNNPNAGSLQGLVAGDKPEYESKWISFDNWSPQQTTARQLRPMRMAIVAGSFPYKQQLEEFKHSLRLADENAVLAETIGEGEEKSNAFDFLNVEVQRVEVDADDNKIGEWSLLPLPQTYKLWLQYTLLPFQPEDPKYNLVKYDGLAMPLLREFHADNTNDLSAMMPRPGVPGFAGAQRPNTKTDETNDDVKTKYPDPAAKLKKLQEALEKLQDAQPNKIAAPKSKSESFNFNPFKPNATLPTDNAQTPVSPGGASAGQDLTIPDYCLMRFVDVDLQPGKRYRYRFKIRMANPNYQRPDVASPDYKKDKELESKEWFEVRETVVVPPELYYYVVDEKPANMNTLRLSREMPRESARYNMWAANAHADQVVLQFHRWVESTPISRRDDAVFPVGDWAIADRVFVARGENIGRKVRVDLPIWKYVQNAFVLPVEEQKGVPLRKRATGIDVDFGQDNPDNETILVDFEGGRVLSQSPKIDDKYRLEVLMLSPDGKLLARNNAVDTEDEERQKRRQEALDRIKSIREGRGAQ